MTTEKDNSAKRGRKPLGEAPMSAAERKRRSREQLRASGVKEFSLQLQGMHLQYVELLAARTDTTTGEALRLILESALDRYVGVMRRCERMLDNGATADDTDQFMRAYWMPTLPPMPELATDSCTPTEPKSAATDAPTIITREVK